MKDSKKILDIVMATNVPYQAIGGRSWNTHLELHEDHGELLEGRENP